MKHDFETHADHEPETQACRNICQGGLAACKTCGGAEGTLTTDCSGYKLSISVQENIYLHGLDYKNGSWSKLNEKETTCISSKSVW